MSDLVLRLFIEEGLDAGPLVRGLEQSGLKVIYNRRLTRPASRNAIDFEEKVTQHQALNPGHMLIVMADDPALMSYDAAFLMAGYRGDDSKYVKPGDLTMRGPDGDKRIFYPGSWVREPFNLERLVMVTYKPPCGVTTTWFVEPLQVCPYPWYRDTLIYSMIEPYFVFVVTQPMWSPWDKGAEQVRLFDQANRSDHFTLVPYCEPSPTGPLIIYGGSSGTVQIFMDRTRRGVSRYDLMHLYGPVGLHGRRHISVAATTNTEKYYYAKGETGSYAQCNDIHLCEDRLLYLIDEWSPVPLRHPPVHEYIRLLMRAAGLLSPLPTGDFYVPELFTSKAPANYLIRTLNK
jgi:hypothetical protein